MEKKRCTGTFTAPPVITSMSEPCRDAPCRDDAWFAVSQALTCTSCPHDTRVIHALTRFGRLPAPSQPPDPWKISLRAERQRTLCDEAALGEPCLQSKGRDEISITYWIAMTSTSSWSSWQIEDCCIDRFRPSKWCGFHF